MDPAQETAARIGIDETTVNALEALRWNWGSAYEIETDGETWRARRFDGLGGWMEAESAEALRGQIVSDYMTRPVDWQARTP
jgi:hypothetical protein